MSMCTKNQREPKLPKKGTIVNEYYMTEIYHSLNMREETFKVHIRQV